jgi:hypothetical protein
VWRPVCNRDADMQKPIRSEPGQHRGMMRSLTRLLVLIFFGCFLTPGILNLAGPARLRLQSPDVRGKQN